MRCLPSRTVACPVSGAGAGGQIRVRGRNLDLDRTIIFRGGRGPRDDVTVRPQHLKATHFEAPVPLNATSGPLEVRTRGGDHAVAAPIVSIVPLALPS